MLALIRAFFAERGVMEVDTPTLSLGVASEPGLQSFSLGQHPQRHLITSPEFAMKRLLAAGCGPIYRLGPAYRAGEIGRWHNPEFCMLEWYRPGMDYGALMDETAELLARLVPAAGPANRLPVADVFRETASLNPHTATPAVLRRTAESYGWAPQHALDDNAPQAREFWLDLILGIGVAEHLQNAGPCFIYDYPECLAMLTRTRAGDPPVAERFELYWQGVELANGGNEITDPQALTQRFAADRAVRKSQGNNERVGDDRLVAAHMRGLPECAGVALGVDRLLALSLGFDSLAPVLSFDWNRA